MIGSVPTLSFFTPFDVPVLPALDSAVARTGPPRPLTRSPQRHFRQHLLVRDHPSVPYRIFNSPSGWHIIPQEGTDLISLVTHLLSGGVSPPNRRMVVQTEGWLKAPELSDEDHRHLRRLADEHGMTLTLKANRPPYVFEWVAGEILAAQKARGAMLAASDESPSGWRLDFRRLKHDVRELFYDPSEFDLALKDYSEKKFQYKTYAADVRASTAYEQWLCLMEAALRVLNHLTRLGSSTALASRDREKADLLNYLYSLQFDEMTPHEYVLTYSEIPKGRWQKTLQTRLSRGLGVWLDFDVHFLARAGELKLLPEGATHHRLPPTQHESSLPVQYFTSDDAFKAAYILFRNLMTDLLRIQSEGQPDRHRALARFDRVRHLLNQGRDLKLQESNRNTPLESEEAFTEVWVYWNNIFKGALNTIDWWDSAPLPVAGPTLPRGPNPGLPPRQASAQKEVMIVGQYRVGASQKTP